MVNPDSDLFRAHPDWALGIQGQEPVLGRHQLVLDLGRPEVSAYLLERLDALLTEHRIGYLKWDMNRDLVAAGHRGAEAGVHAPDARALRPARGAAPPAPVGGDRVVLLRAARASTSASRRTRSGSGPRTATTRSSASRSSAAHSILFPPELMGAHVGPTWSHTTARTHTLPFRAATAIFGHLGFEWDLASASDEDRAGVAQVIALHQRLRPLLHGGRTVRVDHPDPSARRPRRRGARPRRGASSPTPRLTTTDATTPPPLRLPGLDPGAALPRGAADAPRRGLDARQDAPRAGTTTASRPTARCSPRSAFPSASTSPSRPPSSTLTTAPGG